MANKLFVVLAIIVFVGVASALPLLTSGGEKDILGNYYDYTTGQYSSALTGHVFNTGYGAPLLGAPLAYGGYGYGGIVGAPYAYGGLVY